jgi:hypothetical protein
MRLVVVVALACTLAACGRSVDDSTPSGAARLFVAAMAQSADDRHGLEDAYHLLSQRTREALVQRARQTAALGAREREPWEMLVEGTAHLRFEPRPGGYREQLDPSDPDRATVTILGPHDGDRAELPLVHESDGWRVVLDLPDGAGAPE